MLCWESAMSSEELLKERLSGTHLESVQRRDHDWIFLFGHGAAITVGSFWRLLSDRAIQVTSDDDGQQFGLKSPVNAGTALKGSVGEHCVTDVQIDSATSDVTVSFGDGLRLQIVNNSFGYESWSFFAGDVRVIGRNGDTVVV
jgi:hypothetical protein